MEIKWKKRPTKGEPNVEGLWNEPGIGFGVFTETHYLLWEDLEKLPNWIESKDKMEYETKGMCQIRGVGYVIYTESKHIPWSELEKLPKE